MKPIFARNELPNARSFQRGVNRVTDIRIVVNDGDNFEMPIEPPQRLHHQGDFF
jgi:hypothetical protein